MTVVKETPCSLKPSTFSRWPLTCLTDTPQDSKVLSRRFSCALNPFIFIYSVAIEGIEGNKETIDGAPPFDTSVWIVIFPLRCGIFVKRRADQLVNLIAVSCYLVNIDQILFLVFRFYI